MRARDTWKDQAYSFWQRQSLLRKVVYVYLGLVVITAIMLMVSRRPKQQSSGSVYTGQQPTQQSRRITELNAYVGFSGSQFTITNKDSFDWQDVKLEINGGIISGGYQLRQARMQAGQTYTVGAMQFANSDGVRFNPFQMKPQKFVISADTPGGRATYVGEWD